MTASTSNRVQSLDLPAVNLARYAAAIFLVLFHFLPLREMQDGPIRNLFSKGYLGTSFFFLLSGFLLAHVYANRLRTAADVPTFQVKRFARLYPPYLLGLLVALPIALFNRKALPLREQVGPITAYLLSLQAWVPDWAPKINGPAWSVSALMFFYLVFPFALRVFRRLHNHLLVFLAFLWGMYLVPPFLYQLLLPDGEAATVFSDLTWLNALKFNPLIRLPEFLLGMGGAALFGDQRLAAVLGRPWALPGLLVITVLAAAGIPAETPLYPWLHNGLFTPLLLLIVLALAYDQSVVSRAGRSPLGRRLADSSLQIFLLHIPLFSYIFKLARISGWAGEQPSIPFVLLALAVVLAVAYLVDQKVMRPIAGRIFRKWQERQHV